MLEAITQNIHMKEIVVDTLKNVVKAGTNLKPQTANDYHWLEIILKNNPGLITIIITGLLLPIGLVWINNRNTRKLKELEKQLDEKYKGKEIIKDQEKAIYSSLSKILFDVQQLHVSLSGSCVDKNCIEQALSKFDISITKYHEEISNNLLYMPSQIIDSIYKFYSKISDLKISLKEFNDTKNFEMAHVSVYMYSTQLADILMDIQETLIAQDETLRKNFDKTHQQMMKYCCGKKPPRELLEKYIELIKQLKPSTKQEDIDELIAMWEWEV